MNNDTQQFIELVRIDIERHEKQEYEKIGSEQKNFLKKNPDVSPIAINFWKIWIEEKNKFFPERSNDMTMEEWPKLASLLVQDLENDTQTSFGKIEALIEADQRFKKTKIRWIILAILFGTGLYLYSFKIIAGVILFFLVWPPIGFLITYDEDDRGVKFSYSDTYIFHLLSIGFAAIILGMAIQWISSLVH